MKLGKKFISFQKIFLFSRKSNFRIIDTQLVKQLHKNCQLETTSRPFCVYKELSTTSTGKWNFEVSYLYLICISKTIKICLNQHTDLFRFLFSDDSSIIKKELQLVSRPYFVYDLIKIFPQVLPFRHNSKYVADITFNGYEMKQIVNRSCKIWVLKKLISICVKDL